MYRGGGLQQSVSKVYLLSVGLQHGLQRSLTVECLNFPIIVNHELCDSVQLYDTFSDLKAIWCRNCFTLLIAKIASCNFRAD